MIRRPRKSTLFPSTPLFRSAFTLAQTAPPASAAERGWMLTAWGAAALAVLSKGIVVGVLAGAALILYRSEEHTSELQSQSNLVCRLLLEKKNNGLHRPLDWY